MYRLTLLLLFGCRSAPEIVDTDAAGDDWPSYGRDAANTRAAPDAPSGVPAEAWRLDTAFVTSTPAVVDGAVWFGDWAGHLRAVDAVSGEALLDLALSAAALDASPAVAGGVVYVGDAAGTLHAVKADGSPIWSVRADAHPDTHLFGSPTLVGDLVVIGVASTELTRIEEDYTFRGSVVAFDRATGAERWRVSTAEDDGTSGAGVSVWSTAAVDEGRGRLYIGTGQAYEAPAGPLSDALLAIEYETGAIAWRRQFTADDVYTLFDPTPGPDADIGAAPNLFVAGGRDVVGVGDKAGVYAALDRDSGETVWAAQLTEGSHLGGVMTTAAVADGTIYVASNLWVGDRFDSPDNTSVVVALAADDGAERWRTPLPSPAFGAVTLVGDLVVVGTIDGTWHGLDSATGAAIWSEEPGAPVGGGASYAGGRLFAGHGFSFFGEAGDGAGGMIGFVLD